MNRPNAQVVVVGASRDFDRAGELGLALCAGWDADLHLVDVLLVPEQTPLSEPEERLECERAVARDVLSIVQERDHGVDVSSSVRVGHRLESALVNTVRERPADIMVLDVDAFLANHRLSRTDVERIARTLPCDVIVVSGPDGMGSMRTILVPIAGGPHSGLAVEVARTMDATLDVWVDLFHVITPDTSEADRAAADRLLDDALEAFESEQADRWLLEAEDVAEAIVEASGEYDAAMLGTPDRSRLKRFLFGSTTDAVVAGASVPIVVTRRNRERP